MLRTSANVFDYITGESTTFEVIWVVADRHRNSDTNELIKRLGCSLAPQRLHFLFSFVTFSFLYFTVYDVPRDRKPGP